jgi:DNA-binding NarL/FixJ family response regulator
MESVENLLREGLRNPHKFQSPAQTPKMSDVITPDRVRSPYAPSNEPYRHNHHGATPTGGNSANPLSPREIEIVRLLARGNGNKEISTALSISAKTVETYRAKIMLKLQIHSLSDLVLYAVRCGLVKV